MSEMTLEKMTDLIAKLKRLGALTDERERASTAKREASDRWNSARQQYAELHAQIVAEYGEKNAPVWIEALHGQQISRN